MDKIPPKDDMNVVDLRRWRNRGTFEPRWDSFGLISLMMKDYLRRRVLSKDSRLRGWLNAVDKVQLVNRAKWIDLTSRILVKVLAREFHATMERELTESERLFLWSNVHDFVQAYGDCRSKFLSSNTKE